MSDTFLAAFDKLTGLGDNATGSDVATAMAAVETPADTVQGAAEDTVTGADTVQGAAEDTISGGDSVPGSDADTVQGAAEDTVTGADTVKPAEDDEDAFLRRLRTLVEKQEPAPAPAPAKQPAAEEPPLYTAEEQTVLTNYAKEWPDVHAAEKLVRRAEYVQLLNHVFGQVATFLKPHLEMLDSVATRTHLADLTTRVPDYDDVRDQVVTWAQAQPKYLQDAYQRVIEEGTAEEVNDLISRWRADTKQAAAPVSTPKPKDTALPPAAKQAAAAMAPVVSKRTAVSAGVDPSDFDSAFTAAAADKL